MNARKATFIATAISLSFAAQNAWAEKAAVDCSTAEDDLAHLQHEKLSTGERMKAGVKAVFPISLVVHTVKGTEKETMEMATGDYNDKIDARIAEIKETCGLN